VHSWLTGLTVFTTKRADCASYLEQLMRDLAVVAALPNADSGSDGG
jgi:hypothetical protein